jgi:hypothetical protein
MPVEEMNRQDLAVFLRDAADALASVDHLPGAEWADRFVEALADRNPSYTDEQIRMVADLVIALWRVE